MSNNAVEKVKSQVAKTKVTDIRTLVINSTAELGKSLPKHMNAERLVRIALTTLRLNPELYKCTPESFLGALFQSSQLGLEPNVEGQAYILPFNNRRKEGGAWKTRKEAQFIVGFKGYIELFYRHEKALSLDMQTVKDGDEFDYSLGTDSFLRHKPAIVGRGDVLGYYAVAKMKDGATIFKFMSLEECMEHGRKHSKCYDKKSGKFYDNTPWATESDAMCMKTVLIQLMKILPKSVELQKAVAMDNTTKSVLPGKVKADMFEIPDETNWNEDGSQDVKAEVVNEKETVNKDTETEKALDELEQLRQELKDDIIFRNVLGKSFGVENTDELTDKQIPAFKKEIRAIIDDLENIKS